jgi:ATP synthase I subunit
LGLTWDLQIKIFKNTIVFAAIAAVVMTIFIKPVMPLLVGLLFGTLISMLNFRALALTLEKAVKLPPAKAQVYAGSRYFIRFLTNGIVIFVSIKADYISIIGTIIGLIIIKLVILKTNLFNDMSYFKKIFKRKEED